jgi:outer membrane protein OmpA-like peptidoglycan-associated protein
MIKSLLMSCLLLTAMTGTAYAQSTSVDKTTIIRSLAPIKYLAQHSGQARALDLDIEFQTGSSRLTQRAKRQLEIVAEALKDRKLSAESFQIIGHTDASGAAKMNLTLSQKRAQSVYDWLVLHGGIGKKRLVSSGLGETRLKNPVVPNGRVNRRVEFVLIRSGNKQPKSGTEKVIKW